MVTWLKKFSYSNIAKSIAIFLLSISVLLVVQGFLVYRAQYHDGHNYYTTWEFEEQFIAKAGFVRDWIVRYADEDIFNPDLISDKDIEERIKNSLDASTYKNLTEVEMQSLKEQAREGIINDRKQYLSKIKSELRSPNIEYFAYQIGTDKVITNIPQYNGSNKEEIISQLENRDCYLKGNGASIQTIGRRINWQRYNSHEDGGTNYQYYQGPEFPGQYDYEIYVAVAKDLQHGDWIYTQKTKFDKVKGAEQEAYPLGAVGIVVGLISCLYGLKVIGRKYEEETIHMNGFDSIPFEIQIGGTGVILMGWLLLLINGIRGSLIPYDWVPYTEWNGTDFINSLILYVMLLVGIGITLLPLTSFIRHIKNHSLMNYIVCIRVPKVIMNSIKEDNLIIGMIIGSLMYFGVNGLLVIWLFNSWGWVIFLCLFLLIVWNGVAILGLFKITMDYICIAKATKRIATGELQAYVELKHSPRLMKDMAEDMNNIGRGFEEAVERTVRSERLKTELITNVSHDLKTPLTSIISYIDLLKDEKIDNEVAKEYIEVLAERSHRLKHLVEDLVEASKAATGNVKADLHSLELSQLVIQAVGEYGDRLEAAGLEVVMKPLEEVNVLADGRHMWRVIENLLSNVSKYAMPHTRVYVEVRKIGGEAKLTIKNISKESLHLLDPSDLTERFVRGDDSRTTEGSGLGLAIAQSLTLVQGGEFKIELDGDLFKVEVTMLQSK